MQVIRTQFFIGGLVCVLLLSCAIHVAAQTSTPATSSAEIATSTATDPEDNFRMGTQNNSEVTSPLSPAVQTRLINLAANMSNRADAYLLRFELIIVRMESRLKKLEMEGRDSTNARMHMDEAKAALQMARNDAATTDVKVRAFVTAENYTDAWFEVRDTFVRIKNNLLKTKQSLIAALASMKESPLLVSPQESINATNTPPYAE